MSILIKGMEMPTSCLHGGCPIDGASCSLWEEKYWESHDDPYRKRHPNCPLVPVPPHGGLIDRGAFVKSLATLLQFPSNLVNGQWIVNTLREQPAIIPAEESKDNV